MPSAKFLNLPGRCGIKYTHKFSCLACLIGLLSMGAPAMGGSPPVADVSLSVEVTPNIFGPLSTGEIALTLHNDGPDTAGATGVSGNVVFQKAFLLARPSDPPPYQVLPGTTGCNVTFDLFGPNVNGVWGFVWSYYYAPLAAGASKTCRVPIRFIDMPLESFDTNWRIFNPDEDPNQSNNIAYYRFIAGVPLIPAEPVPGLSLISTLLLAFSVLFLALCKKIVDSRRRRTAA